MPAIRKKAKRIGQSLHRKHRPSTELATALQNYTYPTNPKTISLGSLIGHRARLIKILENDSCNYLYLTDLRSFPKTRRLFTVYNQRMLKEIFKSAAIKKEIKGWQTGWAFDPVISKDNLQLEAPAAKIETALKAFLKNQAQTVHSFWSTARFAPSGKVIAIHVYETEDVEEFLELLFAQNTHSSSRSSPAVSATLFKVGTVAIGGDRRRYRVATFGRSKRWVLAREHV